VAAGEKDSVSLYFTGAPRYKHTGEVVVFRKTDNTWNVLQRVTGEQVGPHFLIIIYTARIINVNGLHLYSVFLTSGHPKRCTILPHIHHSHTDGGVSHAGRQPAGREQLGLGALLKDTSALSEEEPGIEPTTFRLPADPLYLLSYCRSEDLSRAQVDVESPRAPKRPALALPPLINQQERYPCSPLSFKSPFPLGRLEKSH
jgi:hypothetical protein